MDDLTARVDTGVRPAGDGQPHRLRSPKDCREAGGQDTLDGPAGRLGGPAGEVRPVVAEVEANAHDLAHGQRA